ncbi:MAG: serine/threonine protein kinase [Actinobacteria bacterium]|nr:serine/threonine protein kinase [Actinomycetota bacterium]
MKLDTDDLSIKARRLADPADVKGRRKLLNDHGDPLGPAPTSMFVDIVGSKYPVPDWLITENYEDETLGRVKSGKEGEVFLVERRSDNASCLLARKSYKDPDQRAFRRDQIYREGRKIRRSRDRRALELGTAYGNQVMASDWVGAEFDILRKIWIAGVRVPYPVSFEGGLLMQFLGDWEQAAPRVMQVRFDKDEAEHVCEGIFEQVRRLAGCGLVHADLSAYNVLYWQEEVFLIDFPQSVEIPSNPHSIELLTRDVTNICNHFAKYGCHRDVGHELGLALANVY